MARCFVAGTVQHNSSDIISILASNRLMFRVDTKVDKSLKGMTRDFVPGNVVWVVYDCEDSSQIYKILALVPYSEAKEEDIERMVG